MIESPSLTLSAALAELFDFPPELACLDTLENTALAEALLVKLELEETAMKSFLDATSAAATSIVEARQFFAITADAMRAQAETSTAKAELMDSFVRTIDHHVTQITQSSQTEVAAQAPTL